MRRCELVTAEKRGSFRVVGVATIDEGVSLLTGVPAGHRDEASGTYPADSVFGRCAAELAGMAERMRLFREV